MSAETKYRIKDVEEILRVNRKTLCYWEKMGKIPAAKRDRMSNYRFWTRKDLKKLKWIVGRKS